MGAPRNVEAGVLIKNRHFADQLRQQIEGLIQSKQVRRLPGFSARMAKSTEPPFLNASKNLSHPRCHFDRPVHRPVTTMPKMTAMTAERIGALAFESATIHMSLFAVLSMV